MRAVEEIARTGSSAPLTDDPEAEFAAMPLKVDGDEIADLQLALSRGGRIHGRVLVDGQPPPPGRFIGIRAEPTGPESLSAGVNSGAIVRADGTFEIMGVTGEFVLRVSDDTHGVTLSRVKSDDSDITDTGLAVEPGKDVNNIEVILTTRPTEIAGRVIAGDRTGHDGCWVIVFSQEVQRWSWPATRYVAAARVGSQDTFRLRGLPSGAYFAAAVSEVEEGQWFDPDYLRRLVRQAKSFELREDDRKIFDLSLKFR
jgi:hypothetical protein